MIAPDPRSAQAPSQCPRNPLRSSAPVKLAWLLTTVLAGGCATQPPSVPAPERGRRQPQAQTPTLPSVRFETQAPWTPAGPDLPVINPIPPPSGARPKAQTRELVLHIDSQRFEYFEDRRLVHYGPLSSGRAEDATPKGTYSVGVKIKDKVSSKYRNQLGMQAWMPWSVQIHGSYFLHEGWLPGYPDSHGCVRVGAKDAKFLYTNLRRGDRIVVTD
jgi:lipoprotein-anchoring transpeptidase ErfK/SrfK